MKPFDWIILFFLLGLGLVVYLILPQGMGGEELQVYRNGKLIANYSLGEDRVIEFESGTKLNQVTIKDGEVYMSQANCYNLHCLDHKPISKSGESIVCLPHGFVLVIKGSQEDIHGILN